MSEPRPPRHLLRSIGAVFAGLVAIFILSIGTDAVLHAGGVYPPPGQPMATGLWLLATAYRIVYGILGCYIAARLAPNRPMAHALVLGLIGVAISTAGGIYAWDKGPTYGPRWYAWVLVAITLPSAWLGGKLHARRRVTATV